MKRINTIFGKKPRPSTPLSSTAPSIPSGRTLKRTDFTTETASITSIRADAIVNAANAALQPGGGVCGAIYNAAGTELHQITQTIHQQGCEPGQAKIVSGKFGALHCDHVIHAVGPDCRDASQNTNKKTLLADAYKNAVELADQHGCLSIAFPALSTGIYGYPLEEATQIAVQSVTQTLKSCKNLNRVIFSCFDTDPGKIISTQTIYDRALDNALQQTSTAPAALTPPPAIAAAAPAPANAPRLNLQRFHDALTKNEVSKIKQELESGQKTSHWMWYAFPQLAGMGESDTSKHFAIQNVAEAQQFLADPQLSKNLKDFTSLATQAVTGGRGNFQSNLNTALGTGDAQKLHACMTLFDTAERQNGNNNNIFGNTLELLFNNVKHPETQFLL